MSSDQTARVLIVVGDASETVDTLYPFYRLQEAGFTPVVAGPERRTFQMVMHEVRPGWTITREWEGYQIEAEVAFEEVDPDDYLGVFYSGGRAPEYIRYDEDLVRFTKRFFTDGKPIASVCHGVEIPAYAGCVKGRRMATVPKCRFDLEVCGGVFVGAVEAPLDDGFAASAPAAIMTAALSAACFAAFLAATSRCCLCAALCNESAVSRLGERLDRSVFSSSFFRQVGM